MADQYNEIELKDDTVLSSSQVAALLRVSVVTVEMWARNNVLRGTKTSDGQFR